MHKKLIRILFGGLLVFQLGTTAPIVQAGNPDTQSDNVQGSNPEAKSDNVQTNNPEAKSDGRNANILENQSTASPPVAIQGNSDQG